HLYQLSNRQGSTMINRVFQYLALAIVTSCSCYALSDELRVALRDENYERVVDLVEQLELSSVDDGAVFLMDLCNFLEGEFDVEVDRELHLSRYYKLMTERHMNSIQMGAWWGWCDDSDLEWRCNSKMIFGGVEVFAGILCCIPPGPWGKRVGVGLIWDGVSRFGDGLTDIADENERNHGQPYKLR
ncbi:MAG: hypothetical protein KDK78_12365, partial [Chlamydiia bacterium]|nr:hypothetical protein [Chlamydiia bacterium]